MTLVDRLPRVALARAGASLAILAALWVLTPPARLPSLCGFLRLTGRPCPLCGLTRALPALVKGQWAEALRLNALTPLALVMLLSLFWPGSFRGRLWTAGLAAFAAYGLTRLCFPGC